MVTIQEFINYLDKVNNQSSPAFLSLFNYLIFFEDRENELTPQVFEIYFQNCLNYSHWLIHKNELSNEIKDYLVQFLHENQLEFDLDSIRWPQEMQVFEINNINDLLEVTERYIKSMASIEDKYKVLPQNNTNVVAIILKKDRSLEVHSFHNKMTLQKGQLYPLSKGAALYFNSQLELSEDHIHSIEIAPFINARLTHKNGQVSGSIHRGYVFQKIQDLQDEPLEKNPRLHLPIKRLEQFFVDRKSDAYYQKMLTQLERTRALVHQGDKEALRWSVVLLAEAETALENIYIGDKMLGLLIRDLRFTAESRIHDRADLYSNNIEFESDEDLEECLKISPLKKLDLIN